MQAAVAALEHRVAGEGEHGRRAPHREEAKAAGTDVGDLPVSAGVIRGQDPSLAAVRLLAGPVVLGNEAVLLIEEGDRDRLEARIGVAVGGAGGGEQARRHRDAGECQPSQWM